MTRDELADEYEEQYRILKAKVESLTPLLFEYTGKDLYELRRKLVIYEDMAYDCKALAIALRKEG